MQEFCLCVFFNEDNVYRFKNSMMKLEFRAFGKVYSQH
jgi:hypothetical protein